MMEAVVSLFESALWAAFQMCFHGSKYSKRTGLIGAAFAAVLLTINIWVADRYVLYSPYTFIVDFLILAVYSTICLQGKWYLHILSIILYYLSLFVCNFSCLIVFSKCFRISVEEFIQSQTVWRIVFLISTKILLIVLCLAMLWSRTWLEKWGNSNILVLFMPTLTIVIVSILMELFLDYYYRGGDLSLVMVLILAILAMLVISLYLLYRALLEKRQKSENMLLQRKIEMQEDAYTQLHQNLIQSRKFQHDIKHKLVVIEQLLQQQKLNDAEQYLREYLSDIDEVSGFIAANTVWETVVAIKRSKAAEKKIEFQTDVQCDGMKKFDEMDLSVLFGNLLDNAIEAEEKLTENRKIWLVVKEKFGIVFIKAGNRIEDSVLKYNPQLKTTKANSELHGLGIKCMKEIVTKYKGSMELSEENDIFWITIFLTNLTE